MSYIPYSISEEIDPLSRGSWVNGWISRSRLGLSRYSQRMKQLESLKQPSNTASIEVLKSPAFWAFEEYGDT